MWTLIFLNHSIAILLSKTKLDYNISNVFQFQIFNLSFAKSFLYASETGVERFLRMKISHMLNTSVETCDWQTESRRTDDREESRESSLRTTLWIIFDQGWRQFPWFEIRWQIIIFEASVPRNPDLVFFDIQHRDDEKCDKTETTSTRVEFDDVHARDLLEIPRKYNRICKHSPITDAIVVSIFPLGWKENYRCHDSELCSENVTSRDWHMKVEGVGCLARVGVWEGTVVNMT